MQLDLHGYHPHDVFADGKFAKLVRQTWEMGDKELRVIHGHGRNRGISPGFVNTNTGYFGLEIRRTLRHDKELRKWIKYYTLDCSEPGATEVLLKSNPNPTRTKLDEGIFGNRSYKV